MNYIFWPSPVRFLMGVAFRHLMPSAVVVRWIDDKAMWNMVYTLPVDVERKGLTIAMWRCATGRGNSIILFRNAFHSNMINRSVSAIWEPVIIKWLWKKAKNIFTPACQPHRRRHVVQIRRWPLRPFTVRHGVGCLKCHQMEYGRCGKSGRWKFVP